MFISPCVAKRAEGYENNNVDYVMNYEELGALFVAKRIQIAECGDYEDKKPEPSKQGRNFGFSGGVFESVKASLKNENAAKACIINGLNKDSIRQLRKFAKTGECEGGCNLVEVMCCEGGCIGGNATMNNQRTAKKLITNLSDQSKYIEKID